MRALAVREMLGLSDRGEIVTLFERTMNGEIAGASRSCARFTRRRRAGDILVELAEFCHLVTAYKIAPEAPDDPAIGETERRARANSPSGSVSAR